MEEAQTVNLDIAAAVARYGRPTRRRGRPARRCCRPCPAPDRRPIRAPRAPAPAALPMAAARWVNYSASLSASYQLDFWGQNRDASAGGGGDRDRQPVRPRGGRADHAGERRQCLFPGAGLAGPASAPPQRNIASAERILNAIKERVKAGTGTDLDVAQQESVLANQTRRWCRHCGRRWTRTSMRWRCWCRARRKACASSAARWNNDRHPARHAGPAVGTADPASGYPPAGGAARLRHRQCRQRAGAVLSEHPADRAGRLPEPALVGAVPAACGVLQRGRRRDAADLRWRPDPGQFRVQRKARQDELLQTYRKTVVQSFADVDNALVAIRQTTHAAAAASTCVAVVAARLPPGRAAVAGRHR